jgi:hypothetical protein
LLSSGGGGVGRAASPPAAALPGWGEFQRDCVAGPSPSQGSAPEACVCWEWHLQAASVVPGYAVDVLLAAQAGYGTGWMQDENLAGNVAVYDATQGCGLA